MNQKEIQYGALGSGLSLESRSEDTMGAGPWTQVSTLRGGLEGLAVVQKAVLGLTP